MRVHRFAAATAFATFGLLIAGGLVSATDSGLACPDWPLCQGQVFPKMVNGKEFEHTHRLIASFVGAMTFGLAALLWKHRRHDAPLKWLGVAASGLVVVQALLGALTVWMELPVWVSSTHLGTAMAFFGMTVSLAFLAYQRRPGARVRGLEGPPRKRVLGLLGGALLLTYAQILVGAVMRHTRSGLVCGFEILTCLGELWPTGTFLGVQIHMWHRLVGLLAGIAVVAFGVALLRAARGRRGLQAMGWAAMTTVVAQIVLGIYSVLLSRELVTMTFHSSVAALLLAELVAAWWMVAPSRAPEAVKEHELAPAKASGSLEMA